MPPANDPFSNVQQTGSSIGGGVNAEEVEDDTSKTSEVVADEIQTVVNESAKVEEEPNTGHTDEELREITQPISNDPMLEMVAQAQAEEKEEVPVQSNTNSNNQTKRKKKR